MKNLIFLLLFSLSFALEFPKLTGRVVDEANILSPQTKQLLEKKLKNFEQNTSNQIVVVTLKSLQGHSIEEYGYQLGRHWGIGQKGKNNGVLLIVAPNERKVRIEVGYGLEGTLTDAKSFLIINDTIIPYFKKNDYDNGVIKGVEEIIKTIKNTYKPSTQDKKEENINEAIPIGGFVFLFLSVLLARFFDFLKRILPAIFISVTVFLVIYFMSETLLYAIIAAGVVFGIIVFFNLKNPPPTSNNNNDIEMGDIINDGMFMGGGFGGRSSNGGGFSGGGGDFGGGGSSGSW